jgi:DNA helicase HerA-like ATPase
MSFLGTGQAAITNLEIANKAAAAYQRKLLEALRRGDKAFTDEKLEADLDKAKQKAIDAFTEYANSIVTGRELHDLMKYDSTDVLKSVVDRLENLNAIGIFKATPPPFDPNAQVWRYNIKALTMEERKLFVLFRLEEIFADAVQRGEQDDVVEVVILDEAHIYADEDPDNIINNIAKEARKFGLAMICASQSPTHFTEDFISSVATKVILGIDEMYWRGSVTKMRVTEEALAWIKPQKTMLVQLKTRGETRNDWRWTLIS